MKIQVLYLGKLECFKYHLVKCENNKEQILSPISAVLIQHPILGNILYDTGNSPYYSTQYPAHVLDTYPVTEFISIKDALCEVGLTVNDIDMIIMSHLHFDHAGGLQYFKGTKAIKNVIVSKAELENAQNAPEKNGAYVKELFSVEGIEFHTISNNTRIADDIELFIQQSHTPGVIGLLLLGISGKNMIFTSDTIYTKESFHRELPPGGTINKTDQEFFDNLKIIKKMQQDYQAELFFGHDYEQVKRSADNSHCGQ